ncbi:MAG: hypothetical protein IK137_01175 [Bacilli bacterium]|nr:hypothetical protein [Bacilli bacterium]
MKKFFVLLLTGLFIFGIINNVYAEEAYYTNPNGVEFTREEYDFLTTFYNPKHPEIMTRDMYDEFVESDLINSEVEIITYTESPLPLINPNVLPNSTYYSTPSKTVQIGKGCFPTLCTISIQNNWHVSPSVRSWDNIGAYLDGVSLISHDDTYVYSTAGINHFAYLNTTNGIGNSVELPATGENIIISMDFKVSKGGTVYGSYQHAMQNTTLVNSQNYTLDILGYGNVFSYYGNAIGIYDNMNGVDIDV